MSNFAIGLIEPISSSTTTVSSGVATAAGTSGAYVFNDEPGLVYRSNTVIAAGQTVTWDIDFGKATTIGMIGVFGLPETFTGSMYVNLSNVSSAGVDIYSGSGTTAALPFSSSYTSAFRRGVQILNNRYTARYARFVINITSTAQVLEVARIALCDCLQPVNNVEWGLKFEADDTSKVEVSDLGYDEVVQQRILPMMTGTIPWGSIAEEPRMRKLVYRAGQSREVVACLDPADTTNGEDKTIWGRFKSGASLVLTDYDINELDFSVRAIQP